MSDEEVDAYLREPITMREMLGALNIIPQNQDGESMPAEKIPSPLAGKSKLFDKSIKKHAKDSTNYGLVRLPGGIPATMGVARLRAIEFGEAKQGNNKGQPYCRLEGVVHEPKTIATPEGMQKVAGLQTSIIIMLCDTKDSNGKVTTADENLARLMLEMRRLGGEDFTEEAETVEDLVELCNQLVEAKPFFRFSTELSKPQIDPKTKKPKINPATGKPYEPRVFENWYGTAGVEDYEPQSSNPGGGVTQEEEEETTTSRTSPSRNGAVAKEEEEEEFVDGAKDIEEEVEEEAEDQEEEEETEDEEEEEASDENEVEEEEDEAEPPTKGDVTMYRPIDPKTKKLVKNQVECEVVAVDKKARTVTLKNLETKKQYLGIPWDELSEG